VLFSPYLPRFYFYFHTSCNGCSGVCQEPCQNYLADFCHSLVEQMTGRPGERQLHSNNPNHLPYILEFGSLINPEAASWMGSNPSRFSHKKWLIYGSLGVWRLEVSPGARGRRWHLSTSYQQVINRGVWEFAKLPLMLFSYVFRLPSFLLLRQQCLSLQPCDHTY
jgi:hypothetical protein